MRSRPAQLIAAFAAVLAGNGCVVEELTLE